MPCSMLNLNQYQTCAVCKLQFVSVSLKKISTQKQQNNAAFFKSPQSFPVNIIPVQRLVMQVQKLGTFSVISVLF